MHDLPLHGQDKEDDPIAEKDGPEDRHIEHREESHREGHAKSFRYGVPEKLNKANYWIWY